MLCLDPTRYSLAYDPVTPDFLFVTEHIYVRQSCRRDFCAKNNGSRLSLFFSGEAIFPDMNIFDYAVAFDRNLVLDDRICRLPILDFFHNHVFCGNLCAPRFHAEAELRQKTGFCNFIYSNPKAHPNRDKLFYKLSEYKRVDSLGPHLNNVGSSGSRESGNWRRLAMEMKRPYKFSIASENASYNGYATEKILSSFQAYTVPIYWGDPSIANEFNPKAFINANANPDFDEVLRIVKEIDGDDDKWCQMVSQPMLNEDQFARYTADHQTFVSFIHRVFNQNGPRVKRTPEGYWPDIYRTRFRRSGIFGL